MTTFEDWYDTLPTEGGQVVPIDESHQRISKSVAFQQSDKGRAGRVRRFERGYGLGGPRHFRAVLEGVDLDISRFVHSISVLGASAVKAAQEAEQAAARLVVIAEQQKDEKK